MTLDHDNYAELVEAAIRREMDILGDDQAVVMARDIDGLDVDDDGTVTGIDRSSMDVLEELVDAYVEVSGDIAAFVIARRLSNMVDDSDGLPDNVAKHV
jgi:hypothetical protein